MDKDIDPVKLDNSAAGSLIEYMNGMVAIQAVQISGDIENRSRRSTGAIAQGTGVIDGRHKSGSVDRLVAVNRVTEYAGIAHAVGHTDPAVVTKAGGTLGQNNGRSYTSTRSERGHILAVTAPSLVSLNTVYLILDPLEANNLDTQGLGKGLVVKCVLGKRLLRLSLLRLSLLRPGLLRPGLLGLIIEILRRRRNGKGGSYESFGSGRTRTV